MSADRRNVRVVAAILEREGKYLITQRRPTASLPLLWEFPGGRVEEGETDEAALARELHEEMGIDVAVDDRALHLHHAYADYDIDFRVYRCRHLAGDVRHLAVHDHRWVLPGELDQFKFPAADERTMRELVGEG